MVVQGELGPASPPSHPTLVQARTTTRTVWVCVWVLRRISMFTASANTFRELRDKHRKVCSALRRMEMNLALTEGKKL